MAYFKPLKVTVFNKPAIALCKGITIFLIVRLCFAQSFLLCIKHAICPAEILQAEGSSHLVVTHKSILRALLCVAMGLPTIAFRAVDIHNGGVCVFR